MSHLHPLHCTLHPSCISAPPSFHLFPFPLSFVLLCDLLLLGVTFWGRLMVFKPDSGQWGLASSHIFSNFSLFFSLLTIIPTLNLFYQFSPPPSLPHSPAIQQLVLPSLFSMWGPSLFLFVPTFFLLLPSFRALPHTLHLPWQINSFPVLQKNLQRLVSPLTTLNYDSFTSFLVFFSIFFPLPLTPSDLCFLWAHYTRH